MQDLIASDQIPVVKLTQVFRQAQASAIVHQAHQINQGIDAWIHWLDGGDANAAFEAIAPRRKRK